jgi:hypothetical protein
MAVAQGINKQIIIAPQSALGTPASTGGQIKRRRTGSFSLTRDTYENDEITSHQQSTGATAGMRRASGRIDGLLSPATYAPDIAAVLRKDFVATAPITGVSVTITGSGPTYTLTRAAGSFLADGIKAGDVIRLSAGALNAANIAKNLHIISVNSATSLTVKPLNGSAMAADNAVTGTTVIVVGKKTLAPLTGHTNKYFTVEEWYPDVPSSELFTDVKVGAIRIGMPASGNATISIDYVALNRLLGTSQVLTSPAAETTTPVVAAVSAVIMVGNTAVPVTGLELTIDPTITPSEAEAGSNFASDINRGTIKVSGSFTAKFRNQTLMALYDAQTPTSLSAVIAENDAATADFVGFTIGRLKIMGDAPNDGQAETIRTYPFTAEINGAGGPTLAYDKTIISVQDSQA